jgi:hypothetical protein
MGPVDRYLANQRYRRDCRSYIAYCRPYGRRLPSMLPGTAAHSYNTAVIQHQAGSHDCRLDAV